MGQLLQMLRLLRTQTRLGLAPVPSCAPNTYQLLTMTANKTKLCVLQVHLPVRRAVHVYRHGQPPRRGAVRPVHANHGPGGSGARARGDSQKGRPRLEPEGHHCTWFLLLV